MPESFSLTFGIELEFVALFPRGAFNNQEPDLVPIEDEERDGEITAGHALQYFLSKANVPATGWEELGSVPLGAAPSYSKWNVSEDCVHLSIDEDHHLPDNYIEEPIEICSRILRYGDDWRGEIRIVLDVMAYMQNRFAARFITNHTTGFHVHVGNAGGQALPFDLVKRIFQVTTAHERVIDSVHASSRVLAPMMIDSSAHLNLLYAPLSFFHQKKDDEFGTSHIFDWLRRIENMQTFEQVSDLFEVEFDDYPTTGHSSIVNFDNLYSDTCEDVKNTVEFRQHVGSLDYAEIVAWVTFLATLAHFCHAASDIDIMELTLRATDAEFTVAELMRAVGCGDDVIQHYQYSEDSVIGVLPMSTSNGTIQPDALASLTEQNDDEVTDNTGRLKVKRLINIKLCHHYYGFDSALGLLPITQPLLQDMLRRAYEKVSQQQFNVYPGLALRDGESQARAMVFGILSEMHKAYDPTECPLQPAIAEGIRRLA